MSDLNADLGDGVGREAELRLHAANACIERLRERGLDAPYQGLRLARDELATKLLKRQSAADVQRAVHSEVERALLTLADELRRAEAALGAGPDVKGG